MTIHGASASLGQEDNTSVPMSQDSVDTAIDLTRREFFKIWCTVYDKVYPNKQEEELRFDVFQQSFDRTIPSGHVLNFPGFADRTKEELEVIRDFNKRECYSSISRQELKAFKDYVPIRPFPFEHHVTDKIVICCYVWNWLLTETNSRRPDSSCSWRISLLGGLCPRVWIGRNGQHSQHTSVMLRKLKNIPSRVPLLQKKRKAAEKEAALIHEENAQANGTFDSKTQVGNCTDSSIVMKSKVNEQVGEEDAVVDCADTNQYNEFDPVDVHKDVSHPCVDSNLHVESCMLVDPVEVHKNITILEEEKKPEPGTAGEEILAFPVEGGAVNSSPKLSTNSKASKLSHPLDERKASAAVPLPPRNGINCVSKSKKRVGVRDTVEKKRLSAGSLHMSIDLPSGTHESSKTASAALQSRNGLNRFSTRNLLEAHLRRRG